MDGPANFAALPNELIAKTVNDPGLKKKDIGRLRLTSKHAYPFATELMVERKNFTELPVMMSEYSLQTFVRFCKKTALGKLVRKVRFSSLRINSSGLSDYARDCLSRAGIEKPEHTNIKCEDLETCLARYRGEAALRPSDEVVKQLRLGFRALARYGNPIDISVSDNEIDSIGLGRSFSESCVGAPKLWSNDYQNALGIIITAAFASGCEIQGLELVINSHRGPDSTFKDNFTNRAEAQTFLNELGSVRFVFLYGKPSRSCIREMGIIVSRARSLKRLDFMENEGRLSFNAIAKAITTTSLQEIRLRAFGTTEESLMKVLEQNRGSIAKLHIGDCTLTKGSWESVLTYIKDELPSLESLQLEYLISTQSTMAHHLTRREGREAIKSGLRKLLP